jgi:hypothetical protein
MQRYRADDILDFNAILERQQRRVVNLRHDDSSLPSETFLIVPDKPKPMVNAYTSSPRNNRPVFPGESEKLYGAGHRRLGKVLAQHRPPTAHYEARSEAGQTSPDGSLSATAHGMPQGRV